MLLCALKYIKQMIENIFLYSLCKFSAKIFLYTLTAHLLLFGLSYLFIPIFTPFITLSILIFSLVHIYSGHYLHHHDIEENLKEFENKLKEEFKNITSNQTEEIIPLHMEVKKCNKPFEKKIIKAKIVLIGLTSTHLTISECTEFDLFKPKREDVKKFCVPIHKCEFKGNEEYYYSFIENVFYKDDKLFIVNSYTGSKVIECDEASAKNAIKAIRSKLREREEKRQHLYIKRGELNLAS